MLTRPLRISGSSILLSQNFSGWSLCFFRINTTLVVVAAIINAIMNTKIAMERRVLLVQDGTKLFPPLAKVDDDANMASPCIDDCILNLVLINASGLYNIFEEQT